jgi:hypothetical protein
LNLAKNGTIGFQKAEIEVMNLLGALIQSGGAVDPMMVQGVVEWALTIIHCRHFDCLSSIAAACSAIVDKCGGSRSLLLTSGLLATLQSQITMDKRNFWESILDVLANYVARLGSDASDRELFLTRVKPSTISFAAAVEVFDGGPAAWSALNLMSNLIGLCGEDIVNAMDVAQVFRALVQRSANLDCRVKQAGLVLALNVIWCGCETLVDGLFESGLIRTLGEALSTETSEVAAIFAMTAMERHMQRKPLNEREREFLNAVFVPFLHECLERDQEAVVARASAFLTYLMSGEGNR